MVVASEAAGHVTLDIRAEVNGSLLQPEIQLYAGDTPLGAYPVDVHVSGRTVKYLTRNGDVVATAQLDDHLACPTCGGPIKHSE